MESFIGCNASDSAKINPDEIIILQFPLPQNYDSAPMLVSMLPRRLMELALIKIQVFLKNSHNRPHILNKLKTQIQDRETTQEELLSKLINNPFDYLSEMEHIDDFSYRFWVHFCALIKNDITSKNEINDADMAVLQAVHVIEVYSNKYRSDVVKKQEIEAAFAKLEELMNLPPYRYTLGDIIKFTNDQGIPLLNFYSKTELEAYIHRKITEIKDGVLPAWLTIPGTIAVRSFFRKEHYSSVYVRMRDDTRSQVKEELVNRWYGLIKDFSSELAMDKNPAYERLLKKLTNNKNPFFQAFFEEPSLRWAYQEYEKSQETVPPDMRLFNRGVQQPLYILYELRRKDVLNEVKSKLPIWFSIPVLYNIVKFFMKPGRKKNSQSRVEDDEEPAAVGKNSDKMRSSALRLKLQLLKGESLDERLAVLEKRWTSLHYGEERKNMINDVKALLKGRLNEYIKLRKLTSIKHDDLREIADIIINQNHDGGLVISNDKESLRKYMILYMLKRLLR